MATISHPDRFEAWANGLSWLSMIVALVSYYQHNTAGYVLAAVALLMGAAAIAMSLVPAVRRDFAAGMAIPGGVIGVIASIVRLLGPATF